ncbi:MAG: hypothetical protein U0575_12950 [Phycisphaerales bacterium]
MAASPSLAVDSLEYSGATAPCPAEADSVSATQHFLHGLLAACSIGAATLPVAAQAPTPPCALKQIAPPTPFSIGSQVGDQLGASAALRGGLLVAGAPMGNYNTIDGGMVVLYQAYPAGGWQTVTALTAPDTLTGDAFGAAVAVIDSEHIAVGAPGHDEPAIDAGSVELFTKGPFIWIHSGSIPASTARAGGRFGSVLAFDGNLLAVASLPASPDGSPCGATSVELWRNDGATWTFEAALAPADRSAEACLGGGFGGALAIRGDRVFVGAAHDGEAGVDAGAVYVFERLAGTWTQTAKILGPSNGGPAEFGAALAIRDGLLAIGAPGDLGDAPPPSAPPGSPLDPPAGPGIGRVRLFVADDLPWSLTGWPIGSIAAPASCVNFGRSLGIGDGWRVVVAAPQSPAGLATWMCHLLEFNWIALEGVIPVGYGNPTPTFGHCVVVDGAAFAVGAPEATPSQLGQTGAIFIGSINPAHDCDEDGIEDACQIALGLSTDLNGNGVPDSCDDCNHNGVADQTDLFLGTSSDCNGNHQPDECEIAVSPSTEDCNGNGILDSCEIDSGAVTDCNGNHVPDACDLVDYPALDCDGNGVLDACDIALGFQTDCDASGVPDACELAANPSLDCDGDGMFDACAIGAGLVADCDRNGVPDACEIASGAVLDCDGDGVPDRCAQTYFLDDGKGEGSFGVYGAADWLWLNGYVARNNDETIAALAVAWIPSQQPDSLPPPGAPAKLALYTDPNDDGDPRDAVLVAVVETTFQVTPPNRFTILPITPTVVGDAGEVFYVAAFVANAPAASYPAAADFGVHDPLKPWYRIWSPGLADLSSLSGAEPLGYAQWIFMVRGITLEGVTHAADLDCDGVIGPADLGAMLAAWGPCPSSDPCPADVTQDGVVDGADLAWLLSTW